MQLRGRDLGWTGVDVALFILPACLSLPFPHTKRLSLSINNSEPHALDIAKQEPL